MNHVPKDLLERWLHGWSISGGKPLPKAWKSGFKLDAGDERKK